MSDQLYEQILKRTGFDVPQLFRRMLKAGDLSYGATPAEWKQSWRERALNNPPALMMCSIHVEWLSLEDIASWEPPDYWKAEHVFVPFAQNGAGDVWCWYPAWTTNSEAAVVLAPHDENCTQAFAPSFEGFLFRQLLQLYAEIYEDNADFSRDELQQTARAELKTLKPYLRESWHDLLSEITARPLQLNESWGCLQFLTRDEAKQVVERELAFEQLNQEFAHMD